MLEAMLPTPLTCRTTCKRPSPRPQYCLQVLEDLEYLRRKEYYIATGQRHYYFMNVGNGEVIDAARMVRKGLAACQLAASAFLLLLLANQMEIGTSFEQYALTAQPRCLLGQGSGEVIEAVRVVRGGLQHEIQQSAGLHLKPADASLQQPCGVAPTLVAGLMLVA